MKRLIKKLLRIPANAVIKSADELDPAIRIGLDSYFEEYLFNATNVSGLHVPLGQGETDHVLFKDHWGPVDVAEDGLPTPPQLERGATSSLERGREDFESLCKWLFPEGRPEPGASIYELGCGTGRLLRHFQPWTKECEIWGSDLSATYIKWLQMNFGGDYRLFQNTTTPHLPIPDHSFDYIYAGSVFTHIYDLTDAWLLELGRVLKT